jgi:hypothetical protein
MDERKPQKWNEIGAATADALAASSTVRSRVFMDLEDDTVMDYLNQRKVGPWLQRLF